MERRYQQGIYEADACRCELSSLPDDAARSCFLKRHRRKLLTSLHEAQERLSCIDYMLYELEQKERGADET